MKPSSNLLSVASNKKSDYTYFSSETNHIHDSRKLSAYANVKPQNRVNSKQGHTRNPTVPNVNFTTVQVDNLHLNFN